MDQFELARFEPWRFLAQFIAAENLRVHS